MDIGTFYSLFSATCFTLVGLWWNVVERRSGWAADPRRRRLAGGIYVTFLLPGLMGLLGVAATVAAPLGAAPIQVAAVLLISLVVVGHGLTWEFMTDSSDASAD